MRKAGWGCNSVVVSEPSADSDPVGGHCSELSWFHIRESSISQSRATDKFLGKSELRSQRYSPCCDIKTCIISKLEDELKDPGGYVSF